MPFAADKLYNGYLRRKMPTIVSKVKVREIMIHLPCLTGHDRDTIEAKRETCGNYDGMVLLLDCLKRRENWPEQFIEALEACEQTAIAAEIRAEYSALKGGASSGAGSPPTTVVRAHVHPAPAAAAAPPEAPAGPDAQVAAPLEPPTQQQAHQDTPEPEPEPAAPSPPSTPPPSPEVPHAQVTDTPPPQTEVNSHPEPEENTESDIQDVSGNTSDNGSSGGEEEAASVVSAPPTAAATNPEPPQGPAPPQTGSDMADGSSLPTMTPENRPVQDTAPPVHKTTAPVSQAGGTPAPPAPQVAEQAAPAPADDDDDVLLSKPGVLLSVLPPDGPNATMEDSTVLVQPYSGDSGRLEISESASDAVTVTSVPACSAAAAVPPACQENGLAPDHNQPEENHYESPSMGVLENVVHVSEMPSILNLDGQDTSPHVEIMNGETAKDQLSSLNGPGKERCVPSEPAAAENEDPQTSITQPNTKYILTAAGVGACALLFAWKFKK
ncbi:mitochondrial antiviral-signaling protein [Cololabis saira]|uniref:mitochondrial antiviral-signaling protein n=1 Tax=Cololabis saira TaxID=129043 RepID=UPI002AD283C1|nr:mitochondrial antiviral-signaling protein [Cololabis saira]